MARQDGLMTAESTGEQRLRKQQAVIETERPARARLPGASMACHGPGQLQAAKAQLGQGHLATLAERHQLVIVPLPERLQQGHETSLFISRRRTRYSPAIKAPINP